MLASQVAEPRGSESKIKESILFHDALMLGLLTLFCSALRLFAPPPASASVAAKAVVMPPLYRAHFV
jgi:hypothetical protein